MVITTLPEGLDSILNDARSIRDVEILRFIKSDQSLSEHLPSYLMVPKLKNSQYPRGASPKDHFCM